MFSPWVPRSAAAAARWCVTRFGSGSRYIRTPTLTGNRGGPGRSHTQARAEGRDRRCCRDRSWRPRPVSVGCARASGIRRRGHPAADRRSVHPDNPRTSQRRRADRRWRGRARRWGIHCCFRGADEGRRDPARRRSGSHALQHALASRADGIERAAGQGRQDDRRAREHTAVAGDRRHLVVEWPAIHAPPRRSRNRTRLSTRPASWSRAFATATFRMPRTPTAISTSTFRGRTCSRWVMPSQVRAGRSLTGPAAAGSAASSAASNGCRRWPMRKRGSCPGGGRCSA